MSGSQERFSAAREGTSVWLCSLVVSSGMIHQVSFGRKFPVTSLDSTLKTGLLVQIFFRRKKKQGRVDVIIAIGFEDGGGSENVERHW